MTQDELFDIKLPKFVDKYGRTYNPVSCPLEILEEFIKSNESEIYDGTFNEIFIEYVKVYQARVELDKEKGKSPEANEKEADITSILEGSKEEEDSDYSEVTKSIYDDTPYGYVLSTLLFSMIYYYFIMQIVIPLMYHVTPGFFVSLLSMLPLFIFVIYTSHKERKKEEAKESENENIVPLKKAAEKKSK